MMQMSRVTSAPAHAGGRCSTRPPAAAAAAAAAATPQRHHRRRAAAVVLQAQAVAAAAASSSGAPPPPPQEQREQSPAEREREARAEVTRRIKLLGQQRRFKEAVQELASLATIGVQPDTQAATALLAACTRSRDMGVAQTIFDQLFGDFLAPDEVTFAVMLRGWGAQSPPAWARIDDVLTAMRRTYGLAPTAVSYNALLEVCYKSGDSDRALDVIDRMAADGVEPDETTWELAARKRTWRSYMRKLFG